MRANQNPGGGSGSADRTQVTGSRGRDPLAPNLNVPTDTGRISTKPWPVTSDGCHGHCHIDRRVGWVQPQQTRCNSGIHGARRGGSKWRSAVSCGQRLCEVRLGYQDDLGLRSGCTPGSRKARQAAASKTSHPSWGPRDPSQNVQGRHRGKHDSQDGHAKNKVGGDGGRTGAGAVEREGEVGNGCVCLVPE